MPTTLIPSLAAIGLLCSMAEPPAGFLTGTWALDADRSNIRGGLRVTIERRGEALRYVSGGVEYTALFDGDDYPIRGISSHATVALRRVDGRSIQRIYKRDGTPVSSAEMSVSADGRFLTVKIRRIDGNGAGRAWVNTYEKAPGAAEKDPFAGTWHRNPIRSLGNSLSAISFELVGTDMLHFVADQVEYSARADGKDYPALGTIVADSVCLTRVDSRTIQELWKEDGKVVATVLRTVSEDGERMTATVTGVTPQGDRFENEFVYRRH